MHLAGRSLAALFTKGKDRLPSSRRRARWIVATIALGGWWATAMPTAGHGSFTATAQAAKPSTPETIQEEVQPPRALGELVVRVTNAWPAVRSYRAATTFATLPADAPVAATPTPDLDTGERMIEISLPDRKRLVVRIDGTVRGEAIVIGDRLWLRGPDVTASAASAPQPVPDGPPLIETIADFPWVEVDVPALDPTEPEDAALAAFVAPPTPPFAGLPTVARFAPLTPVGTVRVGSRTCLAFRAVVDESDRPWQLTVALDDDDRPCLIEERRSGIVIRTTFDAYNRPWSITPPGDGDGIATPAARRSWSASSRRTTLDP